MKQRQSGIALVLTLSLMVVLMTVVGLLSMVAISDMRQSRSSVQQMQARAIAEAGEVYARYALAVAAQPDIRDELRGMMTVIVDPSSNWVIKKNKWAQAGTAIETILNASYAGLAASELGGLGSASISYSVSNFRGGTRSLSAQAYFADYTVVSTGTANNGVRRVEDKGVFEIQIGKPSLSQYLFLVEDAGGTGGFFPTGSRFNGPVHANSNWGFWGKPEFLDTITTAASGAYFYNAGWQCGGNNRVYVEGDSRPPCTVPVFAKGFTRNADRVELPTSSLSQRRAALGFDPELSDEVTARQLCEALNVRPDCGVDSSVPDGVYVVNDGTAITGGIYVKGNVADLLVDGSARDGTQVYEFTQGANDVRVEVDYESNTTAVQVGTGPVVTYTGIPNGAAPLGSGGATGQIYVSGRIDNLRGPGRSGSISNPADHPVPTQIRPALALETQLNITAENRIDLTSDLVYECDPTMVSDTAYQTQYPRCNLGEAELPTVLGVMSLNDDVRITTSTPDDLYLWGSYLAGESDKGLSVQSYSSRRAQGTLRLFGGLIQSTDQLRGTIYGNGNLASGYLETFDYDLRFANGAVAPPNFPTVRTFDVQKIIPVKLSFREY